MNQEIWKSFSCGLRQYQISSLAKIKDADGNLRSETTLGQIRLPTGSTTRESKCIKKLMEEHFDESIVGALYGKRPELPGEEWDDLPGYAHKYQVSTFGRVWNKKGRRSVVPPQNSTVARVLLVNAKVNSHKYINRLVLATFKNFDLDSDIIVSHIDGDVWNNRLENLCAITRKEQMSKRGEKAPKKGEKASKLAQQIIKLDQNGEEVDRYASKMSAAHEHGMSEKTLARYVDNGTGIGGYTFVIAKKIPEPEGNQYKDYTGYVITREGNIYSKAVQEYKIIPKPGQGGYVNIHLSKNHVSKPLKLHQVVATAFLPNPENKPTVNHKDGNKQNNHVDNLEWATHSEQSIHAINELGVAGGKPVWIYDKEGVFVGCHATLASANRITSVSINAIRRRCDGETEQKGNNIFVWADKEKKIIPPIIDLSTVKTTKQPIPKPKPEPSSAARQAQPILAYNTQTKTLKQYKSLAVAGRETGVDRKIIRSLCGTKEECDGYLFEFAK